MGPGTTYLVVETGEDTPADLYLVEVTGRSGTRTVTARARLAVFAPCNRTAMQVCNVLAEPVTGSENGLVTIAAAFVDPGQPSAHTAQIDWGDGGPVGTSDLDPGAWSISASHRYPDDPPGDDDTYHVTVTIENAKGVSKTGTVDVTVLNLPPTVSTGPARSVMEGDVVLLDTIRFVDPGPYDRHTATVTWGDGTPAQSGKVREGEGVATFPQHVYATDGVYRVEVCVLDDDGGSGCRGLPIVVGNAPPVVHGGLDVTATAGVPVTIDQVYFTDPGTWTPTRPR